jgi:hypothetical protein
VTALETATAWLESYPDRVLGVAIVDEDDLAELIERERAAARNDALEEAITEVFSHACKPASYAVAAVRALKVPT